ncbi:MAG: hypothetical protein WB988_11530, partial [Candidatus Nitrosopolaris sp.]
MSVVDALRHLDSIKGNFMLSESEYLASITSHDKRKPADIIIFSNVKEIVEHQQYVFQTFWDKAIPAEQRLLATSRILFHEISFFNNISFDRIEEVLLASTLQSSNVFLFLY